MLSLIRINVLSPQGKVVEASLDGEVGNAGVASFLEDWQTSGCGEVDDVKSELRVLSSNFEDQVQRRQF